MPSRRNDGSASEGSGFVASHGPSHSRFSHRTGGSVVALLEVPQESIGAYGCADVSAVEGEDYVRVNGLVEKPEPAEAKVTAAARPAPPRSGSTGRSPPPS